MTSTAPQPDAAESARAASGTFEVLTPAADTLRASVAVTGVIDESTLDLVVCILRTHLAAGRRYLRLDLAAADVASASDDACVAALLAVHTAVAELGGMLVIENLPAHTAAVAGAVDLFVNTAR